jgi:hypothetical protein
MANCVKCGKPMNPIQVMLSEKSGKCGDCIREEHKKVTGGK